MFEVRYVKYSTVGALIQGLALISIQKSRLVGQLQPAHVHREIDNSYAILALNVTGLPIIASILEGTVRDLCVQQVTLDEKSGAVPAGPYLPLFRQNLEMEGGWSKLGSQFKDLFGASFKEVTSPESSAAAATLFTLRNVFAHGTALIFPRTSIPEELKHIYPYQWHQKLKDADSYLEREFSKNDFLENLKQPTVMDHFWEAVQKTMSSLRNEFQGNLDMEISDVVLGYSFGYQVRLPSMSIEPQA